MKVLIISATFPPMRSGGSDYAFRLCKQLAAAGLEVRVVTSRIENVATDASFKVHPVMRRWSWREMPRLLRIARRFRPDVVNLHYNGVIYHNQSMVTVVGTFLKKMLPDVRVVTHIEYPTGVIYQATAASARAVRKLITRLGGIRRLNFDYGTILTDSDRVIVLSNTHRDVLSQYADDLNQKSVFIPPPPIMPISEEVGGRRRGRAMLGVKPEQILVSYFGYVYPRKGIETLLEAFHTFARHRNNAVLAIIGGTNEVVLKSENREGYLQELEALCEKFGIADKVIWTGYYPTESEQASLYLRATDVCVLPFDSGVYMNNSSFAAAAAHSLPVVSTKGQTVESSFADRENVWLCPPKDAGAMAAAMNELADRPELRQRLSRGAAELTREWFTWDRAVERTVAAFRGD